MTITFWNSDHQKRSMKNFAAFVAENPVIFSTKAGKFICRLCGGNGRVIADYEHPDPVEGYKMADHVTCPSCSGSRYTTEKDYREFFKQEQAAFRRREKERKAVETIRKNALKKLTKEEREVLGF